MTVLADYQSARKNFSVRLRDAIGVSVANAALKVTSPAYRDLVHESMHVGMLAIVGGPSPFAEPVAPPPDSMLCPCDSYGADQDGTYPARAMCPHASGCAKRRG